MMTQIHTTESTYFEKFGRWPPLAGGGFILTDDMEEKVQKFAILNNTPIPEDEDEQIALIRKLFPKVAELLDNPQVVF
ncbi:MAG: hypothetical protein LBQ81_12290 [Zoogloeaceae bacterium]|jgi:hypothetical protein|nr:hypothetical protein [Zoogloeaceae bacterium]